MSNLYDDWDEGRRICCSVKAFKISNLFWVILSLALVVTSLTGVYAKDTVLVAIPEPVYFAFIVFGGFGVLVGSVGLIGQRRGIEIFFLCYMFLMLLGILVQIILYVYLILYANGITTIESVDTFADGLQTNFEESLLKLSQEEPDAWIDTQNLFKCCGIDFEAGVGISSEELARLESGEKCQENATLLAQLALVRADFEAEIPFDIEQTPFGSDSKFFCTDTIALFVSENSAFIGAGLGVILLLQLFALISGSRLYWVSVEAGGWRYELEGAKTAEDYGGGFTGAVRAGFSRLSVRANNAVTPQHLEEGESNTFMNRLSLRRPVTGGGLFGGGDAGPSFGNDKPSFMQRLSKRMPFGGPFGGGGPPAFGGGPPMGGPPMGGPPMGGAPGGGPPAFGSGPALGPRVGGGPPMGGMGMGGPRGMGGGAPRGPPPGHGAPTFGNGPPRGPPPFGGGFGGGLKRMSMRAGQAFNAVGNRFRGGLPQPNTNVGAPDSGTITGGPVNGTRNPMAANTGPSFTANKPGGLMNRMSKRMPKFGGFGRPPPRPSFGGGAPPRPSFGGGGPPRPSFGGGGPPPRPSFGGGAPPRPSFAPKASGGGSRFGFGGKRPGGFGGGRKPGASKAYKPAPGDQPPPANPLMAAIQGGARLKPTQTNDRSAPMV
uniref:WH2 domain-containing protein n=1 Tax=Aplanochytrium stocchinoi TaxID=215587 RepID=A0A7S3PQJ5_9STRA|mmetsp:Transcript_17316/g.22085  ORF Transcript_17316/g.22085 Transcript_17316/m.22085 type:complete len:658 (-) Transcript_17316:176-2149(-)|eukprot:CAMPEP_0204836690 /NCGR_PEP_ID=MMETSP1346-20131115/25872_1 /ASSEMBLY_ACC=CAM_ASM_000771 /TAXON_ID=215587 /ORGANISM="Aplanochytrium stocchinoi, Strain GSBS06" /LENGTH=657 /DNA_ID=CAMNT_0051971605 /DNA_START=185 /DNA_END=2158 /DNA_ORIENTATION=-